MGVFEGTSGNGLIQAGTPDADGDENDGADGLKDVIQAGDGDDTINAGNGDDVLAGGAGSDTFVFTQAVDADTITDFTQGEGVVDLTALVREFDAFTLIASTTGKAGFDLLDSSQTRKKGDSTDVTMSVTQDGSDAVLAVTSDQPTIGAALAELDLNLTLDDFVL